MSFVNPVRLDQWDESGLGISVNTYNNECTGIYPYFFMKYLECFLCNVVLSVF